MQLTEKKLDSTELFQGKLLHAFRDTVELQNGALATREYVVHPGAVASGDKPEPASTPVAKPLNLVFFR